jgi:hypothetical protein
MSLGNGVYKMERIAVVNVWPVTRHRISAELTFEIGHESLCATVEGINDHFAIHGAGDLHTAVLETWSRWRTYPGRVSTDMGGLGGGSLAGPQSRDDAGQHHGQPTLEDSESEL